MKNILKIVALLGVSFVLASCSSDGAYTGTDRGLDWEVQTSLGASVVGRSTTYKFGTEKPLGTLTITESGALDMTGPGVEIYARKMFCEEAPNAAECNGF